MYIQNFIHLLIYKKAIDWWRSIYMMTCEIEHLSEITVECTVIHTPIYVLNCT